MKLRELFGLVETAAANPIHAAIERAAKEGPPKPRLAAVRRAPSRDAFATWRDNPVTQFVFAAMSAAQRAQQEMWTDASWRSGNVDHGALIELRARADAYAALEEASYEAFCEWAGVDPEGAKDA